MTVIPPPYPPRKGVNGCNIRPVIISVFPLVFFFILGRNTFVIFFNNTLNIVSGFWRFLALFINIAKGVTINSFIFNNISIFFVEIVRL